VFSHSVDGIPKPNISWHKGTVVTERQTCGGEELEARERGCYNCNHYAGITQYMLWRLGSLLLVFPPFGVTLTCSLAVSVSILRAILS